MIQADLLSKGLSNTDSLPEMHSLLYKYSSTAGKLDFLRAIHVAGSKGKGSVCAMIESILRRGAGLNTGMFISPHLVHPRERIRINGVPIGEDVFAKHVLKMNYKLKATGELVSFFRFIWLVALEVFLEEGIQVGVIEVGIGGRFDATNVLDRPVVCGITSLAMEHVALLGPSIKEIAWNKAGIMKPGIPVFSVIQDHAEAAQVLEEEAKLVGVDQERVNWCQPLGKKQVKLGIEGDHQLLNASLAQEMTKKWLQLQGMANLTEKEYEEALQLVKWPGRHQQHQLNDDLCLFLDGCHTVESVQYCANWFTRGAFDDQLRHLVFHCSMDRDYRALLKPLLGFSFESVSFVIPVNGKGSTSTTSAMLAHHQAMAEYWKEATGQEAQVLSLQNPEFFSTLKGKVLICGSLYLVGDVMALFQIAT